MVKVKYILFFILLTFQALAQQHPDRLTPLRTNPVLVQLSRQRATDRITPPPTNPIKVIDIPFLDDFSKPQPYPDTSLWINGGVFTNFTYPTCPHTIGVATFDGVNSYGLPYVPSVSPFSSNPADTLTSQYLSLGKYNPGDSLYLSFYWEAGGLGSPPKTNDSLVLEFSNGKGWNEVWYHLGYQPLPPDTGFHYVAIPIISPQYFLNSFQFRFRNYASTAGNLDHWHIDEVYLNQFRSGADTDTLEPAAYISFMYESPSLLKNYEYMPWEQFTSANDIADSVYIAERNNSHKAVNMTFGYTITGPSPSSTYTGVTTNFAPYFSNGPNSDPVQSNPPINLNYTPLSEPATWTITYTMSGQAFEPSDDTFNFNQTFSNYFAYDDGTAESNYSVIPFNTYPTELCEQIKLNRTDTLLGMEIFFNYVLANASTDLFRLSVWGDSNGQPQKDPIYEEDSIYSPYYYNLDNFVYFKLSQPQILSGTIYVGFVVTDGDTLNVGFDLNTNHQNQIFYNVGLGWYPSDFPGSIMIRPVFGNRIFNSVNDITNNEKPAITLYPNPAKDEVMLSESMRPNTTLSIYGSDGRLYSENLSFSGNTLNTSMLPAGFYIVEIIPQGCDPEFKKLLISR